MRNNNNSNNHYYSFIRAFVALGGLVVSVLATGPKVRGFSPGRGRWILRVIKSAAHLPSEGCRRFTACRRSLRARYVLVGKIQRPCFSPAFHLLRHQVVSAGFANRCPWWSYQVARTRLIVGLITPHRIYLSGNP
jgi:hypothetical protein